MQLRAPQPRPEAHRSGLPCIFERKRARRGERLRPRPGAAAGCRSLCAALWAVGSRLLCICNELLHLREVKAARHWTKETEGMGRIGEKN